MAEPAGLPPARREAQDVSWRFILAFTGALAATLMGLAGLGYALYPHSVRDRVLATPLPSMAAPALQTDGARDMAAFAATQARRSGSYGWVDRAHGVVRLPIGVAMQRVVQDGIPGWPTR